MERESNLRAPAGAREQMGARCSGGSDPINRVSPPGYSLLAPPGPFDLSPYAFSAFNPWLATRFSGWLANSTPIFFSLLQQASHLALWALAISLVSRGPAKAGFGILKGAPHHPH